MAESLQQALDSCGDASSLERCFEEIGDFRGWRYADAAARAGRGANSARIRKNGQTACTWWDEDYSITLLFDVSGLCLGVEDERTRKTHRRKQN